MKKEIYCRKCGYKLLSDSNFCPKCGTKVEDLKNEDYIEEVESTEIYTNEDEPKIKKEKKPLQRVTKKLVFDGVLVLVSLVLFILSFLNIYTIKVDLGDDLKFDCSYSAIDFISIMGATTYKFESEEYLEESDLMRKYEKAMDKLSDNLKLEYNEKTGKYNISKKTEKCIHDVSIIEAKMGIACKENQDGYTSTNFILIGITCLFLILTSFSIFILSIIMLIKDLKKDSHQLRKWAIALIPIYFALLILVVFLGGDISYSIGIGTTKLSGTIITSIVFVALSMVLLSIYAFLNKQCNLKKFILSCVSCILVIVTISCAFAPFVHVKSTVTPKDSSTKRTYKYDIKAQIVGSIDLDNKKEKEILKIHGKEFGEYVEDFNIFEDEEYDKSFYVKDNAKQQTEDLVSNAVVARDEYDITQKLSLGYYLIILVFILCGIIMALDFLVMYGIDNKTLLLTSKAIVAVILLLILVLTAIFIALAREGLQYASIYNVEVNIGAGSITMFEFSLFGIISTIFMDNKRKSKKIKDR